MDFRWFWNESLVTARNTCMLKSCFYQHAMVHFSWKIPFSILYLPVVETCWDRHSISDSSDNEPNPLAWPYGSGTYCCCKETCKMHSFFLCRCGASQLGNIWYAGSTCSWFFFSHKKHQKTVCKNRRMVPLRPWSSSLVKPHWKFRFNTFDSFRWDSLKVPGPGWKAAWMRWILSNLSRFSWLPVEQGVGSWEMNWKRFPWPPCSQKTLPPDIRKI